MNEFYADALKRLICGDIDVDVFKPDENEPYYANLFYRGKHITSIRFTPNSDIKEVANLLSEALFK